MPDRLFADLGLAALYDAMCAGRGDFAFYLPLVMAAPSVLDVGCGTGELLIRARDGGHTGRLTGLDPEGMDLLAGDRSHRVAYPSPVSDMGALRKILVEMAAANRETAGSSSEPA